MLQFQYPTVDTWCGRFQYYVLHILAGLMLFNYFGEDWVWFDAKVPWDLGLAPRAILTERSHHWSLMKQWKRLATSLKL